MCQWEAQKEGKTFSSSKWSARHRDHFIFERIFARKKDKFFFFWYGPQTKPFRAWLDELLCVTDIRSSIAGHRLLWPLLRFRIVDPHGHVDHRKPDGPRVWDVWPAKFWRFITERDIFGSGLRLKSEWGQRTGTSVHYLQSSNPQNYLIFQSFFLAMMLIVWLCLWSHYKSFPQIFFLRFIFNMTFF